MNPYVLAEYKRLRNQGWLAQYALRAARVNDAWSDAENERLVRIRCEPETDMYEFPDYEGLRPSERKRYEKEDRETVDREGVWWYVAEYRVTEDSPWEQADSIGMVVGELDDGDYGIELKESALSALDLARQDEANKLVERATYAGVVT